MTARPCPDETTLVAFLEGRLGGAAVATVDAHLGTCAACRDLIAAAAPAVLAQGSRLANVAVTQASLAPAPVPPAGLLPRGAAVGRYVILGLVGRGGMGDVYAAYDPELDRRIALKLLNDSDRRRPRRARSRGRMLREAKAIARLTHPNVVAVHDAGTLDDRVFIAMEFVEGQTLAAWLGGKPRAWRGDPRDLPRRRSGSGGGARRAHRPPRLQAQNVMIANDGARPGHRLRPGQRQHGHRPTRDRRGD